jgi:hypothetical protein
VCDETGEVAAAFPGAGEEGVLDGVEDQRGGH